MLVSDFMVNYRLKNTQCHFNGIHGMSQQGCKEKGHFLCIRGRVVLIAIDANLFDIK